MTIAAAIPATVKASSRMATELTRHTRAAVDLEHDRDRGGSTGLVDAARRSRHLDDRGLRLGLQFAIQNDHHVFSKRTDTVRAAGTPIPAKNQAVPGTFATRRQLPNSLRDEFSH